MGCTVFVDVMLCVVESGMLTLSKPNQIFTNLSNSFLCYERIVLRRMSNSEVNLLFVVCNVVSTIVELCAGARFYYSESTANNNGNAFLKNSTMPI